MKYHEIRQILYENHVKVETKHDEVGHEIRTEYGIIYCFNTDWDLVATFMI